MQLQLEMDASNKEFYQKKLPITDLTNLLSQYSAIGNKSMRALFTIIMTKILGTEQNIEKVWLNGENSSRIFCNLERCSFDV